MRMVRGSFFWGCVLYSFGRGLELFGKDVVIYFTDVPFSGQIDRVDLCMVCKARAQEDDGEGGIKGEKNT